MYVQAKGKYEAAQKAAAEQKAAEQKAAEQKATEQKRVSKLPDKTTSPRMLDLLENRSLDLQSQGDTQPKGGDLWQKKMQSSKNRMPLGKGRSGSPFPQRPGAAQATAASDTPTSPL
jgi:membrane protein involved in colicin uptake